MNDVVNKRNTNRFTELFDKCHRLAGQTALKPERENVNVNVNVDVKMEVGRGE